MSVPIAYIGCAGWSLSSASSERFPSEGTHLQRYAQVFNAVEINSSFYRPHQPKTYARWAASVPDGFRFSVKIPRTITHELRLRDARTATEAFLNQISSLGEKLGCLLLQLPPSLTLNIAEAERYFGLLRSLTRVPVVCEPRHVSWFTTNAADLLAEAGVAYVHAHPLPVPGVKHGSSCGPLYIRLHGAPRIYYSAYDDAFIDATAKTMTTAIREKRDAWCIFDNTAGGQATLNAHGLLERLVRVDAI